MRNNRIKRIKQFEDFYDNSKEIFETLRDNDNRAEKYEREYMLCVCPGSRAGGQEKRIVEVFWGARPYEFETKGKSWKSLTETGVTLFFYRNDTGHITISLSPAKTENIKPIEDSISIHKWLDPKKLSEKQFIKSLWNDFIAYMEYTSLDGTPNLIQKFRVSYLRNVKNLVIEKKWQPTKISVFSKDVLKFVLTVGLSGFVFFIVTVLNDSNENELNSELKKVNTSAETITLQLENIITKNDSIISAINSVDSTDIILKKLIEHTKHENKNIEEINSRMRVILNQINKKEQKPNAQQ